MNQNGNPKHWDPLPSHQSYSISPPNFWASGCPPTGAVAFQLCFAEELLQVFT